MYDNRTGKPLTTQSAEAADLYRYAVDLILGSESDAGKALDRAMELDPGFGMAAAARYFVAKDLGEPHPEKYRDRATHAAIHASDWERDHIGILIGLMDQPDASEVKARAYIKSMPGDLLVISQLTGYLFFYGGSAKLGAVLNVLESVEHALADDWAFLARLGFAASEAGQRKRGRALIEHALEIRPQALYSIHALAHLLHDAGAAEESSRLLKDWLMQHEAGAREGQMYGHVQWHLALTEWQIGDREVAMQRFLNFCAPDTTTCGPILTLADCGGFLLRNYLETGRASNLGREMVEHIERVWGWIAHPFIALHVAGLYASAGDLNGLKRCEQSIAATPAGANRDVSLNLVNALHDYVDGDCSGAAQKLAMLTPEARIGIGGSNVERELVDLIEMTAKMRH